MADRIVGPDSKGRYHRITFQDFATSCGPACVAMTERIYKYLYTMNGEARARALSQRYPGPWTLSGGTSAMINLSYVLNAEGIRAYAPAQGRGNAYAYLRYYACFNTPVIARIGWSGGGGHFAVCGIYDTDDRFVFYDPWYGLVEVTGWQLPGYQAPSGESGEVTHLIITYR